VNTAGNQNTSGTAAGLSATLAVASGGTGATAAAAARTNLGATTLGANLFTLANVAAISFARINADNTVSALDAAAFKTAIGVGTSSGTVTNIATGDGLSGGPISTTGTITVDNTVVRTSGNQTIAGVKTFSSQIVGSVSGTAGSISGFGNPSVAATADTIVYRDTAGYIKNSYFFSTDDINTNAITHIIAKFGDDFHRSATAAKVATFISGQTMNINGSSATCTGLAASATTAAACTGNAASATTAAACTGNAVNVTGTVAVANGGTGATSFTANQILFGNGTGAIQSNSGLVWTGNLGVGTSPAAGYKLDVNGTIHYTTLTASSDGRFKKNVQVISNPLDRLSSIRGVKFEWNEFINDRRSGYELNKPTFGVIAQEIEQIFPELITLWKLSDDCADARSVNYEKIIPILIEAIKELNNKNKLLESRILNLENK
jgi:hypothetical protein